jgi:undecaprenyl-diphosphatase
VSARFRIAYFVTALSTVAVLIRLVRSHKTDDFDLAVTHKLQSYKAPWFSRVMHAVSWAGFPPQSRTLPIAIPAVIAVFGRPFDALFQLLAWGTSAISGTLKMIMRRPRPSADHFYVAPARIGGTSFPSGHVINYTGVYGFLAFLAGERIKNRFLRRSARGFFGGLIALVGPSRIYLGHHWATDVTTSYLLGSSYLLFLTGLYRRLRRHGHGT